MSTEHHIGNANLYTLEADLVNKSERELADGVERDPITKLRLLCLSRGASGILGLARAIHDMDNDWSQAVNERKFIGGIRNYGFDFSDQELKKMFQCFDEDGRGSINMADFLLKLRPPVSDYRKHIIDQVFSKIDKDHHGIITLKELKKVYSVQEHPKYQTGEMSEDEILAHFLSHFAGGHNKPEGSITKEEFLNYYACVSASIDNDMYFDLLLRQVYAL